MRFLVGVALLPVFLALLSFALANRQDVTLSFWPFDAQIVLPLSLVALGLLFLGILLGAMIGWLGGLPKRLQAYALRRELAAAQKHVTELQTKLAAHAAKDTTQEATGRRQPVFLSEGSVF